MTSRLLYWTVLVVYATVLWSQLGSSLHIPDYVYSRSEEIDSEEETPTPNFTDIEIQLEHECNNDRGCDAQEYCHAGEGPRVCLPCRRHRRRCHRDSMCCGGSTCRRGVCLSRSKHHGNVNVQPISSSEEESISQNTRDDMFKAHEGAPCNHKNDCMQGLCCAHHFWTRRCKRILDEEDVCTKPSKRQQHPPAFERCPCGDGLACKRDPTGETRLHTCQRTKHRTN